MDGKSIILSMYFRRRMFHEVYNLGEEVITKTDDAGAPRQTKHQKAQVSGPTRNLSLLVLGLVFDQSPWKAYREALGGPQAMVDSAFRAL